MHKIKSYTRIFALALASSMISACASSRAFRRGERAFADKNMDLAVQYYHEALQYKPANIRYRFSLSNAMITASNIHMRKGDEYQAGGDLRLALIEYQKALDFNPENATARQRKMAVLKKMEAEKRKEEEQTEIERAKSKASQRAEEPGKKLEPSQPTIILDITSELDIKQIFKLLQRSSGIIILLDEKVPSMRIQPHFSGDLSLEEILDMLMAQCRLFYKVINPHTIIVAPDTPNKHEEYDEFIMRTFYLSNARADELNKQLRDMFNIKGIIFNTERNSITLRDTPEKIRLVEKFIEGQDRPRGELLVDVEIIEVNRKRMKEYGIELSQYQVTEMFSPGELGENNTVPPARGNVLKAINSSDFLFSLPSVAYKLLQEDSKSNIKAKPQLRGIDGELMKLHLGDKVPIPTTTFIPAFTSQSPQGFANQPITSFQQQDIGIKIEITPWMHHDGWVTLKMKFEFTFITSPGTTSMPPTIGTRSVETIIRLHDDETALLAGLLRDAERESVRGFPFLSEVPILKHLFSSNKREIEQNDIVLTLTPRIVRLPDIREDDLMPSWAGTQQRIGFKPPPPPSPLKKEEKAAEAEKKQTRQESQKEPAASDRGSGPEAPQITLQPEGSDFFSGRPLWVSIVASSPAGLSTLDLEGRFSPQDLQVRSVAEGGFVTGNPGKVHFFQTFDNGTGTLRISLSSSMPGAVTKAEVARLYMEPRRAGTLKMELTKVVCRDAEKKEITVALPSLALTVKAGE